MQVENSNPCGKSLGNVFETKKIKQSTCNPAMSWSMEVSWDNSIWIPFGGHSGNMHRCEVSKWFGERKAVQCLTSYGL